MMGPKKSAKMSYSRTKELRRNAKRAAAEKQATRILEEFPEDITEELRVPRGGEGPDETRIQRGISAPLDDDDTTGTMISVQSSSENTLIACEEYDPENPSVPPGFEALGSPTEVDEWHDARQLLTPENPQTETKDELDKESDTMTMTKTKSDDDATPEHVRCRLEMIHDNWQTLVIDVNYLSSSLSTVEVAYGKLVVFQRLTFTMPEKFNLGTLYCLVSEQKRFQKKLDFIRYQFNEAEQTINDNQDEVVTMYDVYELFRIDANTKLAAIHTLFNEMVGRNQPDPDGNINLEQIVEKNSSSQEELREFHNRQEEAIAAHEISAVFLNVFRESLTQVEYVIQRVIASLNVARSKLHSFRAKCYRLRVARSEFLKEHNMQSYEIEVFTFLKTPMRDSMDDVNILTAEEFVKSIRDQPMETHIETKKNTCTSPVQKVNESTSTSDIHLDSTNNCQIIYANAPKADDNFFGQILDFSIADDRCGTPPLISMDLDVNNISPPRSVVSHRGTNTIIIKTIDCAKDIVRIDGPSKTKPVTLKTDVSVTTALEAIPPSNQSCDKRNRRKRKAPKCQSSTCNTAEETSKPFSLEAFSLGDSNASAQSLLQAGWSVSPLQHSDTVVSNQEPISIDTTALDDFDFPKPHSYDPTLEENLENIQTEIFTSTLPSSKGKSQPRKKLSSPPPAVKPQKRKHHKGKYRKEKKIAETVEHRSNSVFEQSTVDESALTANDNTQTEETISEKENTKKPKRKSKTSKKQNQEQAKIVQSIERECAEILKEGVQKDKIKKISESMTMDKLEITKKLLDVTKTLKEIIIQNKDDDESQVKKALTQSTAYDYLNITDDDKPKEKGKRTPGIMTKNKSKKVKQGRSKDEKQETKKFTIISDIAIDQLLSDKSKLQVQDKKEESKNEEQIPSIPKDSCMIPSQKSDNENITNRLTRTLSDMMTQDFNLDKFVATHLKNEADLKEFLGRQEDITAVEVAVILLNSFRDHLVQFELTPKNIPDTTNVENLNPDDSLFENQTLEKVNSVFKDNQLAVSEEQELADLNKIHLIHVAEQTGEELNEDNLEPDSIVVEQKKEALAENNIKDINLNIEESTVEHKNQKQQVSFPDTEQVASHQTMQADTLKEFFENVSEEFISPLQMNKQEIIEQQQTYHKLQGNNSKVEDGIETKPVYVVREQNKISKKRKRIQSVIKTQPQLENRGQQQNIFFDNKQTSQQMNMGDLESDQIKLNENTEQCIVKYDEIEWENVNVGDLNPFQIILTPSTSKETETEEPEANTDLKTGEEGKPTETEILKFIEDVYGTPKQEPDYCETEFMKKYMLSSTIESPYKAKYKKEKMRKKRMNTSQINSTIANITDRINSQCSTGSQFDLPSRPTRSRYRQERKLRIKARADKMLSEINLQKELETTCTFIVDAIKSSLLNSSALELEPDACQVNSEKHEDTDLTAKSGSINSKEATSKLTFKQKREKNRRRNIRRNTNKDTLPPSKVTKILKVNDSKKTTDKVVSSKSYNNIMSVEMNQLATPSTSTAKPPRKKELYQLKMPNTSVVQEQMQTIDKNSRTDYTNNIDTETDQPTSSVVMPQPKTATYVKPVTADNKTEKHRPRKEIAAEVKIKIKSRPLLHPDINLDKKLEQPEVPKWNDKNRKENDTDDTKEPRPILGQQETLQTPTSEPDTDLDGEGYSRMRHKRLGKFCDPILSKRSVRILDQHKIHEKDSANDPNSQSKKEINIYNKKGKGFKSIKKSAKDHKSKPK